MLTLNAWLGLAIIAIAVAIGFVATAGNFRNARGPIERAFVLRSCVAVWAVILVLLALMYFAPSPYRFLLLIPYFTCLPAMVYQFAKKHQAIRRMEGMQDEE